MEVKSQMELHFSEEGVLRDPPHPPQANQVSVKELFKKKKAGSKHRHLRQHEDS